MAVPFHHSGRVFVEWQRREHVVFSSVDFNSSLTLSSSSSTTGCISSKFIEKREKEQTREQRGTSTTSRTNAGQRHAHSTKTRHRKLIIERKSKEEKTTANGRRNGGDTTDVKFIGFELHDMVGSLNPTSFQLSLPESSATEESERERKKKRTGKVAGRR